MFEAGLPAGLFLCCLLLLGGPVSALASDLIAIARRGLDFQLIRKALGRSAA